MLVLLRNFPYKQIWFGKLGGYGVSGVCWLFIFKVTEPSSIPYGTHSACAKRAAYPNVTNVGFPYTDPPPVIPLPDTGVAPAKIHLPQS